MEPVKSKKLSEIPRYKIAIYKKHPSGIGDRFIKYEYITEKPSYDTHFFDVTNGEWAREQ